MAVTALRSRWFGTNAPPCTSLRYALCQRTQPTSPAAQAWPTPRGTALLGTARQEDQEGKSFARETGFQGSMGTGILPAACWRLLGVRLRPPSPVEGQSPPPAAVAAAPPTDLLANEEGMGRAWCAAGVLVVAWWTC